MTPDDRPDLAYEGLLESTVRRFRPVAAVGTAGAAAVAVAGLLGYVPGLRVLGSIRADYIPMAPSTAACFLILSAALYFNSRRAWHGAGLPAMSALVLLVMVFGVLTVAARASGEFVTTHPGARTGEFVHLLVSDNGSGMDAQTRSHLFEPFFTTKAPGKGTGLGLSTVYGIVDQHHGFIDVESSPGAGTTIHLYFPRASPPAV